ncbi:MAG TPA: hypothetical protein VJ508_19235 [Saprospiraceae bacterium]|nr:hypothetical protein [Saprospiraceae bacterium]
MNNGQRTRIRLLTPLIMALMLTQAGYPQNISSSRSIALAAATATSTDFSSLDWNPSRIILLNDWEASVTADYSFAGSTRDAVLRTLALGRQLSSKHAVAAKLSPGSALDFVVPSTFTLEDSSQSLQFDKKISFKEQVAFGYAARVTDNLSVGASIHLFDESITDTRYTVDTNSTIRTSTVNYSGNKSVADIGATWFINDSWTLGVVAKNLFDVIHSELDESVRQYELNTPTMLRFGVGYEGVRNVLLAVDGDTERRFGAGAEWSPMQKLQLRGGVYVDAASSSDAIAVGTGTIIEPIHLDVSFLAFLSQDNRQGQADIATFLESGISNIDFNQFTSNRVSITARINFGELHESAARIEEVSITQEIFPASRMLYALRPIGTARVRNTTTSPIEAKVSFHLDELMDAPSQTPAQNILPGEVVDIPLYAVFSDALRSVSALSIREAEVRVAALPDNEHTDRYQTRLVVHGKNDWNGDVTSLKFFVTPDVPEVLGFTREVLSKHKSDLASIPGLMQNLQRAKIVFEAFAQRLVYVNDPKKSEDFVQYPSETLSLNGGDCDDMSVCYSSLLASMGISTAFVDVVPPAHPEQSHIYMMFDTGIDAGHASTISENPKRYMVRKNAKGEETAWIPIETTAITKGFDEAWSIGAKEYFDDVEVNFGIIKGWVKLVDYETVN